MWTRGTGRRSSTPTRGARRIRGEWPLRKIAQPARAPVAKQMKGRGLRAAWRRIQRRMRSLWHWVILRTVRAWYPGRGPDAEVAAGDVREFPQRGWR